MSSTDRLRRSLPALAGALLLLAAAAPVHAQEADSAAAFTAATPRPAPALPQDHWAVHAASRAEALGLVDLYLPPQRSVSITVVGAALREAALRAPTEAPHLAGLTRGWRDRFTEEFSEWDSPAAGRPALLDGDLRVGYRSHSGSVAPASRLFTSRIDPTPLPDVDTPVLASTLTGTAGSHLYASAEPVLRDDGLTVPRWTVGAGLGGVTVSAGAFHVGFGPGRGGGIVLSGAEPHTGIELRTDEPFRLPGFLAALGPVSLDAFLSRMDEPRHPGHPFFWGMRGAIRPHPRLTVALNRASIFGGDSISGRMTPLTVAQMLVGMLSHDFENQVVAAEFRYRAPTESVLPVTLYLEWGADDAAGGWWDVPGRVFGAYVPALPGAPQLSLGGEYTLFAALCCGNPSWYTHGGQIGGWSGREHSLGHPLGGEGRELLLYGGADLVESRLRIDGRAFVRDRGTRGYDVEWHRAGNQFVPHRAGRATGLGIGLFWRAAPRVETRITATREAGRSWREQGLSANVSWLF